MQQRLKAVSAALAVVALAGCGGGGAPGTSDEAMGPTIGTYIDLADATSVDITPLVFVVTDNAGSVSTGAAGTLARATDRVDGGPFAGDINSTRTEIDQDAGGTATLTRRDATEHVRLIDSAGGVLGSVLGVLGQPTLGVDLPDGGVTINGYSEVTIVDGNDVYALTGAAIVTANFDTDMADLELSDLDGTLTAGANAPIAVNNVAIVTSTDNLINGSGAFSGGDISVSGSGITITANPDAEVTQGQFFGPLADEVGGVLILDDTQGGDVLVIGRFVGD